MNIDLDELKQRWAERDRQLDSVIRLNRQLLSTIHLNPARSAMQGLTLSLVLELLFTVATVALLGSFIGDHIRTAKFALPGAALDVLAIALLQNLIRQIIAARRIDYAQPIATIQKTLARLQMLRIRYTQGIFLVAVLAWPLVLIVLFKAFFGLDAYRLFGTTYLWANVLLGLAIIPLAISLSKKFGDHINHSPIVRHLARTIGGRNLNEAAGFLAKLSAFENEPLDDRA